MNPVEFQITSPKLLDTKIKEIQQAIDTKITWSHYSFARAYKQLKEGVYYPEVWQGSTLDLLDVFPNDNYPSYSFVYIEQPIKVESYENGNVYGNCTAQIIFFFNQQTVDGSAVSPILEKVKQDVIIILDKIGGLKLTQIYDEIEQVYSSFTIAAIQPNFISSKYGALRFDCELRFSDQCN